jgi:ABC-2 type transport system ATP-binding protein
VSLRIETGEIVCVMGPNGAGNDVEFRRRVGFVVGDERSFHWALSGRHNLEYFGALHGYPPAVAAARAAGLLADVGLKDAADRPFRTYSRGMRQRLALARGLLGTPEVLLLDEPTLGLDPRGARDLRKFLRDDVIAAAGRTAVVGTNDPGEARALGDRVLLLDQGRLVGETTAARIEQELGL